MRHFPREWLHRNFQFQKKQNLFFISLQYTRSFLISCQHHKKLGGRLILMRYTRISLSLLFFLLYTGKCGLNPESCAPYAQSLRISSRTSSSFKSPHPCSVKQTLFLEKCLLKHSHLFAKNNTVSRAITAIPLFSAIILSFSQRIRRLKQLSDKKTKIYCSLSNSKSNQR